MLKNQSKLLQNQTTQIRGKILWIDDEIELLKPHIILLTQRGYNVHTASNGEDAIEMVGMEHYDLIFLDEMMIGISGLETLPKLKEIDPGTHVVMVTKNEAEDGNCCRTCQYSGHIVKLLRCRTTAIEGA